MALGSDENSMISALYSAAAEAAPGSLALQRVVSATGSDKAFLGTYDAKSGTGQIRVSFNMEDHFIRSYDEEFSKHNVWLHQQQFFQADNLVWIGSEIVPTDRLIETEFYELFLSPQAILRSMHGVIRAENGFVFHLTLTRRPDEPEYTSREVDCVRIFASHCSQAMDLHEQISRQFLVRNGLSDLLTHRGVGVCVLDSHFEMLHCNEMAFNILEMLSGSASASPRPRKDLKGRQYYRCHLPRRILDELSSGKLQLPVTLISDKEDSEYPIIFHVHEVKHFDAFTGLENCAFLVVIVDPELVSPLDVKSISDVYRLTPSEARVSALIAAGERVEEAALHLGITASTARTHLKRIFEKTRTSRQAELVKLLLDSARRKPITRHFEGTQRFDREHFERHKAEIPVWQKRFLTK